MHIRDWIAALVLAPALSFGQLGSGTLTVTSSQSSNASPDQALFGISVESGIDRSLDDILAALAGAGISAADLSGLSLQSGTGARTATLDWAFQLTAPLSRLKETTASLASLQKSIAQNKSGLTLSFALANALVSAQQSQACDFQSLMTDARTRAQNIAGAAGFSSGTVVGIISSITQSTPDCLLTVTFGLPVARSAPNTITITASRTANLPPDQVLIGIGVTSGTTSGLDDINAALAGAGIAGANLASVYTQTLYDRLGRSQPVLQWSFTLTAPLAKLPSTLARLGTAQQTVSDQNPALSFSFDIQGLQASPQSQPVCQQGGLIADARSLAQTVAAAAGVSVGAILNMSDQAAPTGGGGIGYASFLSGDFTGFASFGLLSRIITTPSSNSCALSLQFQLL